MECLRDKFVAGVLLDGRYQTISPLNHGSFGMVFMAQDLWKDQPVAIKCLTKKSASNDAGLDLAVDDRSEELALHRSLGPHANIVNLLHSFETEAHIYLVMEFCSQGDLYEAIRNGHGPLQTEHVRQFMIELVDAVAYIHSKGVYHRDIKPENIFLSQDGAMKLGDFGLATTDKWSYEMTVGSDRYMAPEQFDSAGAGYSPAAADIWAIGICLLNILFSRNPFTTPTEADPLFLDFSRDKQSLFDVFPAMSQDTYEVIVQCMNLDPRRRSLVGAREALRRVVSFTTEDESLDDFCGAEKATVASANREPLRTPSIQSPHAEAGVFPWATALHAAPNRPGRQLSAIPDDESYTEDLFSKSGETADWCSASIQTPSMSSMLDSQLGASMKSLALNQPSRPTRVSPASGSLPITMAKPLTLSMLTDGLWPSEGSRVQELERHVGRRRGGGARAADQVPSATQLEDLEPREQGVSEEGRQGVCVSRHQGRRRRRSDGGRLFLSRVTHGQEDGARHPLLLAPVEAIQLWAALGERRRGQGSMPEADKSPGSKPRRHVGFGYTSCEAGVSDYHSYNNNYHHFNNASKTWGRERAKECPRNKGREWNWRRDRRPDLGDTEWVGGW